ncbi:MAG: hypothetical protein NVSMB9_02390 [Isosphaeraceae bacterium]
MRIGLEMFGTQTEGRFRGIGRFGSNFAAALRTKGAEAGHDFVFYALDELPTDLIPEGPNALTRKVRPEPHLRYTLNRLACNNPDGLDALVFVNPLELNPGNDIPPRHSSGKTPWLTAVIHDLIPLIFQDQYLRRWPEKSFARRYLWALERLRAYDVLFVVSEATRSDLLRLLNLPADKVVTIGASGDDRGARFEVGDTQADLDTVRELGVTGKFIFSVAPTDPRKNLGGLVDAFALLPPWVRTSHSLIVAVGSDDATVDATRRRALALGVADSLILLTRPIDDSGLRALYRRCAAFVFPSLYEGFGLPILEALRCGAPVVAGDNSSQPEVAGDAALLVNTSDPAAIAGGLARVLTDEALAQSLRARGLARGKAFSWDAVALRALDALERLEDPGPSAWMRPRQARAERRPPVRSPSAGHSRGQRPRIAMVSPMPPYPSGNAGDTASLIDALGEFHAIDLFHDCNEFPRTRFQSRAVGCFDHRLFERFDRLRPYHAVVYQISNSLAHHFVATMLGKRPGVVVLHDLALGSLHYERAVRFGGGIDEFRRVLEESHPDRAPEFADHLAGWFDAPEAMVRGLTAAGLDMNRPLVQRALGVIVHSREALERLGSAAAFKTFLVPRGAKPASANDRAAARVRLGLAADALVVGSFGMVHPSRLNVEAIEAFAAVARAVAPSIFLVVGEEADGGLARRRAETLGLGAQVRFLGRPDDERFFTLIAATDIGLILRGPEVSGDAPATLLHLLRSGVATVLTEIGSFAEFPEGIVRKVRWDEAAGGIEALRRVLHALAAHPAARDALGRAAQEHVRAHHSWPQVAARYAEVIAWSARAPASGTAPLFRGPHYSLARGIQRSERGPR